MATASSASLFRAAEAGVLPINQTEECNARVEYEESEKGRDMLQRTVMRRQVRTEDKETPPASMLVRHRVKQHEQQKAKARCEQYELTQHDNERVRPITF